MANRDIEVSRPIKLILSDVDGVMTDGRIVLDNSGIESKSFHVRDGLAIKFWQKAGYHFGILTARTSQIVKLRANELGISLVRQGFDDKLPAALEMISQLHLTRPRSATSEMICPTYRPCSMSDSRWQWLMQLKKSDLKRPGRSRPEEDRGPFES